MKSTMINLVLALVLPLVVVTQAPTASSSGSHISGHEVRKIIQGRTVYIASGYGFEVPVYYGANGSMSGKVGKMPTLVAIKSHSSDRGRWWIKGNQLCQRWRTWLKGATYCFRLSREGRKVYWQAHNGHSGTARIGS